MADALDELIYGVCRRIATADEEQATHWRASWDLATGRASQGDWPTRDAAAAEEDG